MAPCISVDIPLPNDSSLVFNTNIIWLKPPVIQAPEKTITSDFSGCLHAHIN